MQKKYYIFTGLLAITLIASLIFNIILYIKNQQLNNARAEDFRIYPSSLPVDDLLRINEAEILFHRAYDNHPNYAVKDVDALITLIQHAWQWDKNAMLYYDEIRNTALLYDGTRAKKGALSFSEFMQNYRNKLVDRYGNQLVEPTIFQHPDFQGYFYDKMAELGYPRFTYGWGIAIGAGGYDNDGLAKPTSDESLETSIYYLSHAIDNGYHDYETLIARILFQSGQHFKYDQRKDYQFPAKEQINKLTDVRQNVTEEQLRLAIDNAEIMAQHSSLLGMLRVSEAYYYGVGRENDWVTSYAWALLMDLTYNELSKYKATIGWDQKQNNVLMAYQANIVEHLEKELNSSQKQASLHMLSHLKEMIVSWDYNAWLQQVDDFNPNP
ncbi:MAG: hypothetical protein J6562_06485 [Candidatus Schmidhempelia sp.]|nr:hypothetical protein [Candidatus Schmidhempelia sp.]